MLRNRIKNDLKQAILKFAINDKPLTINLHDIEVFRPQDAEHGDYSTNIAMQLVKKAKPHFATSFAKATKVKKAARGKQAPTEFAKKVADSFKSQPYLKKLEVKEPGFINFFIKDEFWQQQVENVLQAGSKFGSNDSGRGKKARVEFVSANPTGPLHFGNARGGPIGDALASVLEFCGYEVLREYLNNDVGVQVEKLGESIVNVEKGQKLEDQEYKGEYIRDLTNQIPKNSKQIGETAVTIILKEILRDCEDMGLKFDKVQAESELISSGKTKSALDYLKKKKTLKKKDGAIWFAPHDKWLEDRETVVVKSNGDFTYFANDIAYHRLKFEGKTDLVVDILGANHHGHVPRLQAVIEALGFDADKFRVILYQWVRFRRGGELIAMSKRSGTFVTAREVLDEVGKDALRFFILMHDAATHIDFDLDLAKEKSSKNPVYYVQYAHARISSILSKAKGKRLKAKGNYRLLTTTYELNLLKQISRLPELVEDIAENFAVNQLTTYAIALADAFHKFYENVQVLTDDKEKQEARLALISAAQIALFNSLNLLGVSAPKKM